jgi:type I restriction enzyme, R subunit
MSPRDPNLEDSLEKEVIKRIFGATCLNWETAQGEAEGFSSRNLIGRESKQDVVLTARLRQALEELNPDLPPLAIDDAIKELTLDRSAKSDVEANREIYKLLKDGVPSRFPGDDGKEKIAQVKVIDWKQPEKNHFLLVSQLTIEGGLGDKRTDLLGFVNGLPLIFIELKAPRKKIKHAYNLNLTDYRGTATAPGTLRKLFWYNAFVILSNGDQAVIGSTTAQWDHFNTWRWISNGERLIRAEGEIQLETLLKGTCEKSKLLDILENFTLFQEGDEGLIKLVGKCHQVLGVNNAIRAAQDIQNCQGKLGVFWHTQGSGKSYSMQFLAEKIRRKVAGNWTFVVVTDRDDLDGQIYKSFANTKALQEPEDQIRAENGEHLKQLLREDHTYVFTLIQKFNTRRGEQYPLLSERHNIVVMVDEAHRSQYDAFAQNMRRALPNASFIGFTGTPLIAGEDQETMRVFGNYVSIYNFKQAIEDEATVPLYYENRIPEVVLNNEQLNDDIIRIIEDNDLDDEQEQKLAQKFVNEYTVITDGDRLSTIAQDIVIHFMTRGYQGKAMVVAIDRFTAIKMYNLVLEHWQAYLADLKAQAQQSSLNEFDQKRLEKQIRYMEEMLQQETFEDYKLPQGMAVVVSQSQNEIVAFQEEGLDIRPHRKRMIKQRKNLEKHFKDPDHPLRIVFVCAMWVVGFDAPSCSTIYLDKPMKNHTLMQTIARANRVFKDKVNGLIVDYIGIFGNLKKALEIYGSGSDGTIAEGEYPVEVKQQLIELMREALARTRQFCQERGVDINDLLRQEDLFTYLRASNKAAMQLSGAEGLEPIDDSIEKIIVNDDLKREFVSLVANVNRIYKAILPDREASQFVREKTIYSVLADKIRSFEDDEIEIGNIEDEVKDLLEQSITAAEYVIRAAERPQRIDISGLTPEKIDGLRQNFQVSDYKRQELERLKAAMNRKISSMVRLNKRRMNYKERFEQLIAEYNANSHNTEQLFQDLLSLTQELSEEDQRAVANGLSEEELAIFDLLNKPDITPEEEEQVKQITKQLLLNLRDKLVFEWNKKPETIDKVKDAINDTLDELPETYDGQFYDQIFEAIYHHIFKSYYGDGQSVYNTAS